MYTNSGTTASYNSLFALLLMFNISSSSTSCRCRRHQFASNLNISYTINMDNVILYYSPGCKSLFGLDFNDPLLFLVDREFPFYGGLSM